jgi:hypothetical protein
MMVLKYPEQDGMATFRTAFAKDVNVKYPQMVIGYYQSSIIWDEV